MHKQNKYLEWILSVLGGVIYAIAINTLVVPSNIYSGNLTGIAQIIRTILIDYLELQLPDNFDLNGVILLAINIPLFIIAFKSIGYIFFWKTIVTVVTQSLIMSFFPIPKVPLIASPLTAGIIGGILAGYGVGLTLRNGGSGGGVDIIGVYVTKKYPGKSVGGVSLAISIVVFLYCGIYFSIDILAYSIIYTLIYIVVVNQNHYQNIKNIVVIISKNEKIEEHILKELKRGVTSINGVRAYSLSPLNVYISVLSKYEAIQIKKDIKLIDPDSFIIIFQRIETCEKFEIRL
jgi:uncharacterized membrane-anchored protein YitT (DUF2179 family)